MLQRIKPTSNNVPNYEGKVSVVLVDMLKFGVFPLST